MSNISDISDGIFEKEVVESTIPVIVDFTAAWCGPCKALAPILDDVASQLTGKVKFVKLNVDDNPLTPPKFGVRGIPTLILFKEGEIKATHVGLLSKADLIRFAETNS